MQQKAFSYDKICYVPKSFGFYLLTALLILLPTVSCWAECNSVKITFDPNFISYTNVAGVGWNMGPLWIPDPDPNGSNRNLEEFTRYFLEAKPAWVRLMLSYYEWECKIVNGEHPVYANDDNDPWTSPKVFLNEKDPNFVWNTPNGIDWRIRYVLNLCEKNGIKVQINNWETWMKRWLDHEKDENGFITYKEAKLKADEFGENVAALLYYLKTKANNGKGYECIKYYSIWNEPGGGYKDQDFITWDFPGYYNMLEESVHKHLAFYDREMGTNVLGNLQCIGFESFPRFRNTGYPKQKPGDWDELLGRGVIQYLEKREAKPGVITNWPSADPYLDIISIHDYWGSFDYDRNNPSENNKGTINDWLIKKQIMGSLEQIKKYDIDGKYEPLYIGELGAYVYCKSEQPEPVYEDTLFIVESSIRAFANGVSGINIWAWNMHSCYAAISYPGAWWEVAPKGTVHPIPQNYFPLALLMQSVPSGASVIRCRVEGSEDASFKNETWLIVPTQRVWATAFKPLSGDLCIVVVNDSYESKRVEISVQSKGGQWQKRYVSKESYSCISVGKVNISEKGRISDLLPPRSIVVYKGEIIR